MSTAQSIKCIDCQKAGILREVSMRSADGSTTRVELAAPQGWAVCALHLHPDNKHTLLFMCESHVPDADAYKRVRRAHFDNACKTYGSFHIYQDARGAGVSVPDHLRTESVAFLVGTDLPVPIPDLEADSWGWCATLSFHRQGLGAVRVEVPWEAVLAIDVPDIGRTVYAPYLTGPLSEPVHSTRRPTLSPKRPALRLIKGGEP